VRDEKGRFVKGVKRVKKLNDFSYVLNDEGQLDYILVDITSSKYGFHQMKLDLDDVDFLKDGAVYLKKNKDKFYAMQKVNGKVVIFHRRLFPDIKPKEEVLHGDSTLDNRRSKLKTGTKRENQRDRRCHRGGHLYGTVLDKRDNKWQARITVNKKTIYLGRYETAEEAHQAIIEYEKTNNII
jgi:hypothetical protein